MSDTARTDKQLIERALELVRDGLRRRNCIPAELFTMAAFGSPACGTAGCIGGWLDALLKRSGYSKGYDEYYYDLRSLFFPRKVNRHWSKISRRSAAKAIDRYLAGKQPWPKVRS